MRRVFWMFALAACGAGVNSVSTSTCATGQQWTGGDSESALMHPGLACISCHTSRREGPQLTLAGTVFPDFHERDDCGGSSSAGLEVVVTGADGASVRLPVNSMGNFMLERGSVALPYSAKVVDANGNEREMVAKQTRGDCNSCHTQAGAEQAPGRIIAP